LQLNYTWGKSIDDASSNPIGVSAGGGISRHQLQSGGRHQQFSFESRAFRLRSKPRPYRYSGLRASVRAVANRSSLPLPAGSTLWSAAGASTALPTFETGEPFTVYSGALTNNGSHQSYAVLSGTAVPDPHLQDVPGGIGPALFADASGFGAAGRWIERRQPNSVPRTRPVDRRCQRW